MKGSTITDWLTPVETKKLIKALKKSKGHTYLTIVKNLKKSTDTYYIDGEIVFERDIKRTYLNGMCADFKINNKKQGG